MPTIRLPVAIARWFPKGEGWSYDQWFATQGRWLGLVRLLDQEMKAVLSDHGGEIRIQKKGFDGWLFGSRAFDPTATDPRAILRKPSILRVAYIPRAREPKPEEFASIQADLAIIPPPSTEGPSDLALRLVTPDPPILPRRPHKMDVGQDWRTMLNMWQAVANARRDDQRALADNWLGQNADASVITRNNFLDGETMSPATADPDHPDCVLVQGDRRVLIAGPTANGNEYAIHVLDGYTKQLQILLTRHLRCPADRHPGFFSRLLALVGVGGSPPRRSSSLGQGLSEVWGALDRLPPLARLVLDSDRNAVGDVTPEDHWLLATAWALPITSAG